MGAQCRVGAGGRVAAAQEWAATGEAEPGMDAIAMEIDR